MRPRDARRSATANYAVAPATLRASELVRPGLVRVGRSSTPARLRDLVAGLIVQLTHVLDELDASGREVRCG